MWSGHILCLLCVHRGRLQTKSKISIAKNTMHDSTLQIDQDGDGVYESTRNGLSVVGSAINDITPPNTEIAIENNEINLFASDADTGVLHTLYSFDGETWEGYFNPIVITEDTNFSFFSVDFLGNTEIRCYDCI